MKKYSYKIRGVATGSVVVPDDATDKDIHLAILDDLYEVSYKEIEEDKNKISNVFNINEVSEVLLLSEKEWHQARKIPGVPAVQPRWWWLRSPGYFDKVVTYVGGDGYVRIFGLNVNDEFGVRPAFHIPLLSQTAYKPGDKITVGTKTRCTVIEKDVILADNIICRHRFDPDNNDWETSELKAFINSENFFKML